MAYSVGSLVRARGREWVVLPESEADFLVLRPLGGSDREVTGVYLPLEQEDVRPATFGMPDPEKPGDFLSCRLLRDAVRLSFRAGAGPFRSFGRISVEPRPYQLVPLLMALRLETIRLLIADDVGIGKTVEACLIARELLDRGEIRRLAVLCPPHLAEQWQEELRTKFHIDAEVVLPSTITRLERGTAPGESLFDRYPFVVVSTEFIKSNRYRDEFINRCPEFVIVDEAHTCAYAADMRSGRHLRHQLVADLARNGQRHMVLVTATPHSGDESAFHSLLGLLNPAFAENDAEPGTATASRQREQIARHLVQRRRADIRQYLQVDTPFPERFETERAYKLGAEYRSLFDDAIDYARERVTEASGGKRQERIRWWSALALLRSLASSPAAAAATMRARSATVEADDDVQVEQTGARTVLDLDDADADEFPDLNPGAQESLSEEATERRRLLAMAKRADSLRGPSRDAKVRLVTEEVRTLLAEGFNPIVFCRFIATAEYVAEELQRALPKEIAIQAVTGTLPPYERELRVAELGSKPQRVLVATDCLSEGVNLQEHFNAVIHYDLSWNPTRHEQREGRVDRYGQASPTIRTLTCYGQDNQIDGVVLEVLIRKHKSIRTSLGISVPVPGNTTEVVQALMEGLMLRGKAASSAQLSFHDVEQDFGHDASASIAALNQEWDNATAREKQSRTIFAQRTIDPNEVAAEWNATQQAVGSGADVRRFVITTLQLHGGFVQPQGAAVNLTLPNIRAVREAFADAERLTACFELPAPDGAVHLSRTHPFVENLADFVVNTALDPLREGPARRTGAMRTSSVSKRTTLLLLRLRHHIIKKRSGSQQEMLAEECILLGFRGAPDAAEWLAPDEAEALLSAEPAGNLGPAQAVAFVRSVIDGFDAVLPYLAQLADERAQDLLMQHQSVRAVTKQTGVRYEVRPHLPVDVLGLFVLIP